MQVNNFTNSIILLSMFLISGCEGTRYAKNNAIQMSKLTLEYETKVSNKVAAEQTFYQDQRAILRCVLSGAVVSTDPSDKLTKCDNIRKENITDKENTTDQTEPSTITIRDTVPYGRIRTDIRRDATLLAEKLISSQTQPMVSTELIQFMRTGLESDWNIYQQAHLRQQQLRVEMLEGLEKMDQQTQRLKTIQKELDKLAEKPSFPFNLKQYLRIAKDINEKINENRKISKINTVN